ncbi:MAG: sphingosine kinase [Chlamydiales bacterium]|jgi:sphingosine kinase
MSSSIDLLIRVPNPDSTLESSDLSLYEKCSLKGKTFLDLMDKNYLLVMKEGGDKQLSFHDGLAAMGLWTQFCANEDLADGVENIHYYVLNKLSDDNFVYLGSHLNFQKSYEGREFYGLFMKSYEKSASPVELYQLAGKLVNAEGCEKNLSLAQNCLQTASEAGLLKAQYLLSHFFKEGSIDIKGIKAVSAVFQKVNQERVQKLLIVINPFSGSKTGEKDYYKKVAEILGEDDYQTDILLTKSAGHCSEAISKDQHIIDYDGIIVVGGDGSVSELVHGLMEHDDARAIDIPIGHVPSGSGNGLAKSLLHKSGMNYGVKEAAQLIRRNETVPMDIFKVSTQDHEYYSFLTVSWGFVSDLDIYSEKFRWFGGARFTLGALYGLWKMKSYEGTLSYLPEDKELPRNMPSLKDPLPEEFTEVDGEFSMVHACNTSHCSYNFHSAPDAKLNDGFIHIHYIKNPLSNWRIASVYKMARVLLGFDDGSFVNRPEVHSIRTKAFRLIPKTPWGLITLDGEQIEYEPFQCQLSERVSKVFCRAME